MKPFEVVGLPPDELNSFLSATHPDPFRVLGPHRMGDDLVIRVFRPDAQKIDIVQLRKSSGAKDRQASESVPARKFIATVSFARPCRTRRAISIITSASPVSTEENG